MGPSAESSMGGALDEGTCRHGITGASSSHGMSQGSGVTKLSTGAAA